MDDPNFENGEHRQLWEEIKEVRKAVVDIATNALPHLAERLSRLEGVNSEQRWLLRVICLGLVAVATAVVGAILTRGL